MTTYICPKCGGTDYFMSTRNVIKGVGGIYGNRGGTKKFPVCRNCDEIMDGYNKKIMSRRTLAIAVGSWIVGIILAFIPVISIELTGLALIFMGIIGGGVSLFIDWKNNRE
jgi:hypothetical protein